MENEKNEIMEPIILPPPSFKDARTIFEALRMRRTSRSIGTAKIPLQLLADILWAGQGINRTEGPFESPGRTAGSASNSREVLMYVALEEGAFLYEPESHRLIPVASGDIRALVIRAGQALAGADAPLRLIDVADLDRFKTAGFQEPGLYDPEIQKSYYFVDTGLIAQNVYLAAAALGLVSWFHNCNKAALTEKLNLMPRQQALFGQTIGYEEKVTC